MVTLYKQNGEFFGEFADEAESIDFIKYIYENEIAPNAPAGKIPLTAKECEEYFTSTGDWTNWLDFFDLVMTSEIFGRN
jgi:hypothetical protein